MGALMCLATSEATSVEEADLSAKGTNPFGGEMGKIKKAAKAKAHGMLKKGGVSGIVPTSRLVKGWLAKADSKYSRKAKKKLDWVQKAKQQVAAKKGKFGGKPGARKKAKKSAPLTKKGAKKASKKAKKKAKKKAIKKSKKKIKKQVRKAKKISKPAKKLTNKRAEAR